MDRCDVAFGLGVAAGVISLFEASVFFAQDIFSVRIVWYLVGWYLASAGLSVLVLFAAFMVYKERKVLGGIVMFVTSLLLPVNFILFMIPGPVASIVPIFYYNPFVASPWLILSMIGGILILSIEMKQKSARAIAFSLFAGVLAFFITPIIVIYSGTSTLVSPDMPIFYISFGVIPFIVAVLTFALFYVQSL